MRAGRWEVVARFTTPRSTWIIPGSEGRHFRRTRPSAWWTALRWTRNVRRWESESSLAPNLHMTWEWRERGRPS